MPHDYEYPFENKSLENMDGEIWKPIPGFLDYYEISNYGRIKSVNKVILTKHGREVRIRQRIMFIYASHNKNHITGDVKFVLRGVLSINRKKKTISVGRIVHYLFNEKFDLDNAKLLVSFIDGNGRNIRPDNLYLTETLSQQTYDKGRNKSPLSELRRPVSQFNREGELVAEYESCYQAGKQTGFISSAISRAALGQSNQYMGYFWQYGKQRGPNAKCRLFNQRVPNLRGEKWKDLPGFEGAYQISNNGRVKRLAHFQAGGNGSWMPEMIMNTRPSMKTGLLAPRIILRSTNGSVLVMVARYVYYLFVKPFELKARRIRMGFHDKDVTNLHYKNIFLISPVMPNKLI